MMRREKLVRLIPYQYEKTGSTIEWWVPEDVAAILNLCEYVIHAGAPGELSKDKAFCDVWLANKVGESHASTGRVFDGAWSNTQQEAIDLMVKWVRDGMPKQKRWKDDEDDK